jgi:Cys-tRNA(Pro)/Cys-tRNA(Cys) deacylase
VSKKPPTTPATAAAEQAGIPFQTLEYELDPRAESFGIEAAEKLGRPPERVFKTLVVQADGEHLFALVPVEARLDTRSLGKRVSLADPDEAHRITGYVKGGTSVFGSRKRLPSCSTSRRSPTRRSSSTAAAAGCSSSSHRMTCSAPPMDVRSR